MSEGVPIRKRGAMERRYTQHPSPAPRDDTPSEYTLAALADEEAIATVARLKRFWRRDGRVRIWTERVNGYLVVRSNLVNGMPPR